MSKTDWKLLLGPQSCLNIVRSVFMRAFQKKSQNLLKVKQNLTSFWHNLHPGCCNQYMCVNNKSQNLWQLYYFNLEEIIYNSSPASLWNLIGLLPTIIFSWKPDKLDGVAPLIADPPLLKLHQKAKSTPSVKWL